MNRKDLADMYHRELAEVMERNGLESIDDAINAVVNEVYASLRLFGRKSRYEIPDGLNLEHFRRDFGKTLYL